MSRGQGDRAAGCWGLRSLPVGAVGGPLQRSRGGGETSRPRTAPTQGRPGTRSHPAVPSSARRPHAGSPSRAAAPLSGLGSPRGGVPPAPFPRSSIRNDARPPGPAALQTPSAAPPRSGTGPGCAAPAGRRGSDPFLSGKIRARAGAVWGWTAAACISIPLCWSQNETWDPLTVLEAPSCQEDRGWGRGTSHPQPEQGEALSPPPPALVSECPTLGTSPERNHLRDSHTLLRGSTKIILGCVR